MPGDCDRWPVRRWQGFGGLCGVLAAELIEMIEVSLSRKQRKEVATCESWFDDVRPSECCPTVWGRHDKGRLVGDLRAD